MTVTTQAAITVGTLDMRAALTAVLPHAEKNKTSGEVIHRVRLIFDANQTYVTATNGFTSGLAYVETIEDDRQIRFTSEDGPFSVDFVPTQIKHLLYVFKAKRTDPEGGQQLLRFDVGVNGARVTDLGGLVAGQSVAFPEAEVSTDFPDVVGVTGRALAGVGASQIAKELVADGKTVKLFEAASRVYKQPLQMAATGTPESRGWVVTCGDRFLGTVESRHHDDDSLKKRDRWRTAWLERLKPSRLQAV